MLRNRTGDPILTIRAIALLWGPGAGQMTRVTVSDHQEPQASAGMERTLHGPACPAAANLEAGDATRVKAAAGCRGAMREERASLTWGGRGCAAAGHGNADAGVERNRGLLIGLIVYSALGTLRLTDSMPLMALA
jgi:hypothetical protein